MVDSHNRTGDGLHDELARLRAENAELRAVLRVGEPERREPAEHSGPVRVLLVPDPDRASGYSGPGPAALASTARVLISALSKREPAVHWRAEHDLAQVPDDAECFKLAQVLSRMLGDRGTVPMTFRVERGDDGQRCLRRCIVSGEPESDRFSGGYQGALDVVDELLTEGRAAHDANAEHHAMWALKAADVVLARLNLGFAAFQAERSDWRQVLAAARPEYDPRYEIVADRPTGW